MKKEKEIPYSIVSVPAGGLEAWDARAELEDGSVIGVTAWCGRGQVLKLLKARLLEEGVSGRLVLKKVGVGRGV